jgi:antitoxin component of MazEF toxin-antitoxin module
MPHKQTRKVIRVGNSLAVTIPKPWLSYFKLSEKDEVTLLSNGAIIIKPLSKKVRSVNQFYPEKKASKIQATRG